MMGPYCCGLPGAVPTRVGVNRDVMMADVMVYSSPHTRGGEPGRTKGGYDRWLQSPHAWG